METLNKQSVMDALSKHTCDILYKKKDGTERVVKATLQESIVPKINGTGIQSDTKGRGSSTCVTVFDVEKSEWRTLIIGNILNFS